MAYGTMPETFGPPPHLINNQLIEAVHSAIARHPNPLRKASYGKMLAMLLGEQAREHQAHVQTSGSAGSAAAAAGHGAVADQGASASGPPADWAATATGNPVVQALMEHIAALHAASQPAGLVRASQPFTPTGIGGF